MTCLRWSLAAEGDNMLRLGAPGVETLVSGLLPTLLPGCHSADIEGRARPRGWHIGSAEGEIVTPPCHAHAHGLSFHRFQKVLCRAVPSPWPIWLCCDLFVLS